MSSLKSHVGLVALGALLVILVISVMFSLPVMLTLLLMLVVGVVAAAQANGSYVWRKLLGLIPILLAVTFTTFLLTSLLPGDPAVNILGTSATPEAVAELHVRLHLDDPLISRYGRWLGSAVTGDLGTSPFTNKPVAGALSKALPKSLLLMAYAQIYALGLAIPLGVWAAYKEGGRVDRGMTALSSVALSTPTYVLAPLLVLFFSVGGLNWFHKQLGFHILPATVPSSSYKSLLDDPFRHFKNHLLPVIAVGTTQAAAYLRLLRSDMIGTLKEDFISVAKAKGMTTRRVLLSHALRPSSFTLLTVLGVNIGFLIGNSLIVEQVFSMPNLGGAIATAVFQRDYLTVQGAVVAIAVVYVFANFAVDLIYAVLDPRVRHARAIV